MKMNQVGAKAFFVQKNMNSIIEDVDVRNMKKSITELFSKFLLIILCINFMSLYMSAFIFISIYLRMKYIKKMII